jgi:Putative F0F1-ATPase subunit Ca2+/Mg2+ transporter
MPQAMQNQKPKNNIKWLALINIPIQMGIVIFGFSYGGNWLNVTFPNGRFDYQKIGIMLGVALAIYNVFRQVKALDKED